MTTAISFRCRHEYSSGFQLDVEFSASNGVTAIVGPSGSGKTTILSIIAGLMLPADGMIRLNNRILLDSRSEAVVPTHHRRVGMLFQDYCLFPHMTVQRNIEYGLKRRSGESLDYWRLIEVLELAELLQRRPETLSGGQKQRVALARAIASHPEILLLDEPLTSVEPELQQRILPYLKSAIAEFKIPTLVVSHNRELVASLAETVIEIENGKLSPRR